jgi:hypothetical protein
MKSCQIASISRLNAFFYPIGATLRDDMNSSFLLQNSTITLGDAIHIAAYIKVDKKL